MDARESLAEFPDAFEAPEDDERRGHFTLTNDRMAAWAARKLAEVSRKQAANQALYEAETARLDAWATDVDRPLARDFEFFEGLLKAYALRERSRDEKRKTIKLPAAVLETRPAGGGWTVTQEAKEWAVKGAPSVVDVDVTFRFSVQDAKKLFTVRDGQVLTEAGEIVPGITVAETVLGAKVKLTPPPQAGPSEAS